MRFHTLVLTTQQFDLMQELVRDTQDVRRKMSAANGNDESHFFDEAEIEGFDLEDLNDEELDIAEHLVDLVIEIMAPKENI